MCIRDSPLGEEKSELRPFHPDGGYVDRFVRKIGSKILTDKIGIVIFRERLRTKLVALQYQKTAELARLKE